jgi:polysaccharide pyruvyl transferase WcaK-like protein
MRFHSLVFGTALGANCVAIDYTMGRGKVRSLAEKHSVPMLDMNSLEVDRLAEMLSDALEAKRNTRLDKGALQFEGMLGSVLKQGVVQEAAFSEGAV